MYNRCLYNSIFCVCVLPHRRLEAFTFHKAGTWSHLFVLPLLTVIAFPLCFIYCMFIYCFCSCSFTVIVQKEIFHILDVLLSLCPYREKEMLEAEQEQRNPENEIEEGWSSSRSASAAFSVPPGADEKRSTQSTVHVGKCSHVNKSLHFHFVSAHSLSLCCSAMTVEAGAHI